jgi:hypothetical protein
MKLNALKTKLTPLPFNGKTNGLINNNYVFTVSTNIVYKLVVVNIKE